MATEKTQPGCGLRALVKIRPSCGPFRSEFLAGDHVLSSSASFAASFGPPEHEIGRREGEQVKRPRRAARRNGCGDRRGS